MNEQDLAPTVTCLGDGHDGGWNIFKEVATSDSRREILDWYHLMENLHKIGGSNQRLFAARSFLWLGKVNETIELFNDCELDQAKNFCFKNVKDKDRDIIKLSKWLDSLEVSWDGELTSVRHLWLGGKQLTNLRESIGQLTNLRSLDLENNQLTSLLESIGKLTNLWELTLERNQLIDLLESIGQLTNLKYLNLCNNQLSSLPESIARLSNLETIYIDNNPNIDLSPLKKLTGSKLTVSCSRVELPHRYWMKLSDWHPEWLLNKTNIEIRRLLIQQLGYEKICDRLGASTIDSWREYILLEIDNFEPVIEWWLTTEHDWDLQPIGREPILLLKMTCPSTGDIHILRVPPEMASAKAAITWVNHGIHPDDIAVQT